MNRYILPALCSVYLALHLAMNNAILQWNCRRIKANLEELNLLINERKPVAVCLQETYLKDSDTFTLKYHFCYFKHFCGNDKASGDVAVIVNNCVPHHSVDLDTTLQAVAVSISLNKTITLCSVYLPPSSPIDIKKVEHHIKSIAEAFYFNGRF